MNPLESLLRPIAGALNRNIAEVTRARELCAELSGTVVAIRVRDSALAMYFTANDETLELSTDSDAVPDVVITGSLISLTRLASDGDVGAIRDGSVDLTGDAETADAFQQLLVAARPDIEEELSKVIGDVAAHRLGEISRGARRWAQDARSTMAGNVREYLQEESRDAPSRYETERFANNVNELRDDVDRLAARIAQLSDSDN